MKQLPVPFTSILSNTFASFANLIPPWFILIATSFRAFLYVDVIAFAKSKKAGKDAAIKINQDGIKFAKETKALDRIEVPPKTCNCLKKENCPINGLCLTERLLYYATITCNKNYTKLYKGICEITFKKRYAILKKSFNIPSFKNDIELSTEYWALKTKQLNPKVSWQIKRRCNSHGPIS